MKLIRWIFWCTYYAFRRQPTGLVDCLKMLRRTNNPYRRFKPNVERNSDAPLWSVFLSDERFYVATDRKVVVDLYVSEDGDRVVGFDVWDSDLQRAIRQPAYDITVSSDGGTTTVGRIPGSDQ